MLSNFVLSKRDNILLNLEFFLACLPFLIYKYLDKQTSYYIKRCGLLNYERQIKKKKANSLLKSGKYLMRNYNSTSCGEGLANFGLFFGASRRTKQTVNLSVLMINSLFTLTTLCYI